MLSEDLENEVGDEYDVSEMDMVKKMIGLNIADANDNSESRDTQGNVKNLLCKSNKLYDLDNPSSKVINPPKIVPVSIRSTGKK